MGTAPTADSLVGNSALPRAEARMLLERASGRRREWLLAHGDEPLEPCVSECFLALEARRIKGEPIAYLCGEREFHGLALRVVPAVLIPRPETELLVDTACARAPASAAILDLGTGSGAIALAIAATRTDLRITATDQSIEALAVASDNARRHGLGEDRIIFRPGSWWQAVGADERFDLIVSNPPYIAESDPHLAQGDLRFEPRAALASGPDGLEALRDIASGALAHLVPGGWLMVEHGWNQAEAVRLLFDAAGLRDARTLRDLAGQERVTLARAPEIALNPRVV
jgi:release factor glutamine methyltransferase